MTILGISAYYHDAAASIITDGVIIAAAQEERFSRIKNDKKFPADSIKFCLDAAGKTIDELDAVVFYDKSFLKFERLIETYYAFAPKGILSFYKSIPQWIQEKIFIKKNIRKELKKIQSYDRRKLKLLFSEHHLSHAASAFFPSGFREAAILTIDGVGEWATTTICKGSGNKIEILKEMRFPHSAGLLYSAFTYYLGFTVNSDEYKLMGLAPYGNPDSAESAHFIELIKKNLVTIYDDGSLWLNQEYFRYAYGLTMTNNRKFEKLFGFPKRSPDSEFTPQHLNLSYAIQRITEEIVVKLARHAVKLTGCSHLCMAGGVALNCVANGKLLEEKVIKNLFIQPAAGDAGGALGAALSVYHIYYNNEVLQPVEADGMKGSFLGPSFSNDYIKKLLTEKQIAYQEFAGFQELCEKTAGHLLAGNVVGWFQGKMEFGPRALGNRSILASAAFPDMQKTLNLKIKFREGFRPFAPAVAEEDAANYFDLASPSPYMLLVRRLRSNRLRTLPANYPALSLPEKLYYTRSDLQAITHVDGTARIQTVSEKNNAKFYGLLKAWQKVSGDPVLVNTSFNVRDEPIVCTPEDALDCFTKTGMDCLVLQNYLITRKPPAPAG
jgi:carbamoyltransferase